MAGFRQTLGFCAAIFSVALWAEDQAASPEALPPLPPQEALVEVDSEDSHKNPLVTMYDEPAMSSSFFDNSSFNTGTARNLNVLDLSGYFRTRFSYIRNGHLGTYIPDLERGTSNIPANLDLFNRTKSGDEDAEASDQNPAQNNFSANMRLRLIPTINVSEMVRVKSSMDIFDNVVLGSTPTYLSQGGPSPSWPHSLMARSQNAPQYNINSAQSAIKVKRLFGEVSFPLGELRFGRMPSHFGLGILYNSGDGISNDYGDQVDGISLTTRVFDHFISPSYQIAYAGPVARGGGFFPQSGDFQSIFQAAEAGQRYPLESGDITHVFGLSFFKRESDFIVQKKFEEGRVVYDYGINASWRKQFLDSQAYGQEFGSLKDMAKNVVKRESNVGLLSLWQRFSLGTFHVEAEAAGIWGKYLIGEKDTDLLAQRNDGSALSKRKIWLLQGGFALESKYGFLQDRLQVGLNGGLASGQSGPGFGIREGSNKEPKEGDADGQKLPKEDGYKTNFKFNPAYTVDLLLYKEVLGGISGTYYVKPHVSYFFSRNFGVRGDIITSLATNKSNTTGNSNWLGVEFDANSFFRTDSGFYFQLAYGLLVPLKGLNHRQNTLSAQQFKVFGEAQAAQTLQAYLGVTF